MQHNERQQLVVVVFAAVVDVVVVDVTNFVFVSTDAVVVECKWAASWVYIDHVKSSLEPFEVHT